MAPIVEGYSDVAPRAVGGQGRPDPQAVAGTVRHISGVVNTVAVDDLTGSSYYLAAVPSDAYMKPGTFFDVAAWPFAQVRIGTQADIDALVTVAQSAGDIVTPFAVGDPNANVPLWQVLGLAQNPGGEIVLYAHAIGDATGAGSMRFGIEYVHRT